MEDYRAEARILANGFEAGMKALADGIRDGLTAMGVAYAAAHGVKDEK